MSFADRFSKAFRYLLPSPFAIAIGLTVLTFLLAWFFTRPDEVSGIDYTYQLMTDWSSELWNGNLMVFAMQMMLMLVLGHVLALTPLVDKSINLFVRSLCKDGATAAASVTFFTILVAFFNWGLALIFGAIFARKVGEHFLKSRQALNYSLIGAAGYSGLMVWHGGISGSSLIKVAEQDHLRDMMSGTFNSAQLAGLPAQLDYSQTVFGTMNVTVGFALIIILPLVMFMLGRHSKAEKYTLELKHSAPNKYPKLEGAERVDHSKYIGILIGGGIIVAAGINAFQHPSFSSLGFINPNWINLLLLGLCLLLHQRFSSFLSAVDDAIGGAAGILIQFPIYFGIMGLMKSSGMVTDMAQWFAIHSSADTYPILTFFSAGLVNIFVPSGGGQWAVQGPVIVQAAQDLGVPLSKSILAMAYGDQLTNMLQPFWALPLLGITQLRAKDIIPYTLILMLVGAIIFITALLIF